MNESHPQVLIVDRSPENREVLRTILGRDGVRTLEATRADDGLLLANQWHPQVLILDSETVNLDDPRICTGFDDAAKEKKSAVVLLGRIPGEIDRIPASEVLSKPYHYAPLIRKIEELLQPSHPTARH